MAKNIPAPKAKDQSIARAGFAEAVGAKRNYATFTVLPSKIRADHYADNHNRAAIYSVQIELPELAGHPALADDRCCFTRAEVLARADSFSAIGQQEPIKVYRNACKLPDLGAGFLRHIAGLYLEVTGKLADAPGLRHGLLVVAEERPKDPLAEVHKNLGENVAKELTPIDHAWACRRLKMLGKSPREIGELLSPQVSGRTVERYLQLLQLSPQRQLDVHEGRMRYMDALREASEQGRGSAKGPRPGIGHAQIRRALQHVEKRPLPSKPLSPTDAAELLGLIAGTVELDNVQSDAVLAYYRAITPTTDEIKALAEPKPDRKARKQAPPRPGAKSQAQPEAGAL